MLVDNIDFFFGEYYDQTFDRKLLHEKLSQLVMDCASFKRKLERGEFDYKFQRSEQGEVYSAEHMRNTKCEDGKDLIVQMSLWPGILKVSMDGDSLLIDQEAVWTSAVQIGDGLDAVLDRKDGISQGLKREDSMEL